MQPGPITLNHLLLPGGSTVPASVSLLSILPVYVMMSFLLGFQIASDVCFWLGN